jgi:murein DD-endopeptidase MepM/ murein hydrolase activator NlpD
MQQYSDNVAMVMVGRTPAVRSQISDTVKLDKTLVQPSQIDSVLRAQMEGDGEYSLSLNAAPRQRDGELFEAPVDGGSIVRHFSHKDNYLGIGVRVAPNSSVVSVGEGSVMDVFSAEAGYTTIVVQHYNGFVSIYHNLVQPLVSRGQTVRSGQVLGYNAMPKVGDEENPLFEMELWSDGKAVDPEIYMVF